MHLRQISDIQKTYLGYTYTKFYGCYYVVVALQVPKVTGND